MLADTPYSRRTRQSPDWAVFAVLAPGYGIGAAQSELSAVAKALEKTYPRSNTGLGIKVQSFRDLLRQGELRLWTLSISAALLFVIMIGSVSNLYLTEALSRRRTLAIQSALGASALHLTSRIVTSALLKASVSTVLGAALSYWAMTVGGVFSDLLSRGLGPAWGGPVSFSGADLLFAVGLGVLLFLAAAIPSVALLYGSNGGTAAILSSAAPSAMPAGLRKSLNALLFCQVLATTVVSGATGFAVAHLWQLHTTSLGFSPKNLLTLRASYLESRNPADWTSYYESIAERLRQVPGVVAATSMFPHPLTQRNTLEFYFPGQVPAKAGDPNQASEEFVGSDFVRSMRLPVLQGTDLVRGRQYGPKKIPALINKTMADRYGLAPGREFRFFRDEIAIVGVVGDVKKSQLQAVPVPTFYHMSPFNLQYFVIRHDGSRTDIYQAIRQTVQGINGGTPVEDVESVETALDRMLLPHRSLALILAPMGVAATLFAILNTVSLVWATVAWRRRELALRVALGASSRGVRIGLMGEHGVRALVASTLGLALLGWIWRIAIPIELSHTAWATGILAGATCIAVSSVVGWVAASAVNAIDPAETLKS